MINPDEQPRRPVPRPKYLGPPPPPYPDPSLVTPPRSGDDRRWKTGHLLAACGLSFALGAGTVVLADGNGSAPEQVAASREVARFSGTGPQQTPAFTVDSDWELRWQSDSEMTISVYRTAEGTRTRLPSQSVGRSGSSFHPDSGSYTLEVVATGTWTVTVVERA